MNPAEDIRDVFDGNGIKPSTWLHLGCYAVLIMGLLIMGKVWKDEAVGRARAEAVTESEKRVRAESKAELEQFKKESREEMAKIKTAPQAVKVIERYVPQAAPVATVTKEDVVPAVAEKLPESPSGKFTIRGDKEEVAVAQTVTDLQVCKKEFTTCKTDLASMTRDRDSWQTTAKGGSKFKRFTAALKYIGIGVGIGLSLRR